MSTSPKFAIAIMWRSNGARGTLFEKKQNLLWASLQSATAILEIADHRKSEDLPIETDGTREVVNVKSRFQDVVEFRRHGDIDADLSRRL